MKAPFPFLSTLFCLLLLWVVACKKEPDAVPKSADKAISTFAFNALNPVVNAAIDANTKAITATVPAGTDVTKLVPTITLSDKATVSPASGVVQDFSKAVTYTVTAEDGSTQAYMATVVTQAISVKKIAIIPNSTFLLATDGTLWVAGSGFHGEFGVGSPNTIDAQKGFVKVMTDIKDIASGPLASHMLFLKNDNTVWAAGYNLEGQIGNGSIDQNISTAVKVMSDGQTLVVGVSNSFVIKTDNTLWAFGDNNGGVLSGEGSLLGDGTTISRPTPIKIIDNVKDVAAGETETLILKTDNTLWGCGNTLYGGLGIPRTLNHLLTPIKLMDGVRTIAKGSDYSFLVKTDNTLWVSGGNYSGQLGIGTCCDGVSLYAFTKVADNVQTVALGGFHSVILKTDNTIWATGDNRKGQLGDGTTTDRKTFSQILTGVKSVFAGGDGSRGATFIIKADNTLWATGNNVVGNLGDGTSNNQRNSFVPILVN